MQLLGRSDILYANVDWFRLHAPKKYAKLHHYPPSLYSQ